METPAIKAAAFMVSSNGKNTPPGGPEDLPGVEEVVIDRIDEHDETVPPEFRGCQVVELRTDHGSVLLYKGKAGFTASEEQARILIQAYRLERESEAEAARSAPEARPGGQPGKVSVVETPIPGDRVLRVLGYGADVPEKLQGSRLIQRGEERFYLTLDGEAIPEDVGRDLLAAWDATGHHELPSEEPPSEGEVPALGDDEDESLVEGEPTVTDAGDAIRARVLELAARAEQAPSMASSAEPPEAAGDDGPTFPASPRGLQSASDIASAGEAREGRGEPSYEEPAADPFEGEPPAQTSDSSSEKAAASSDESAAGQETVESASEADAGSDEVERKPPDSRLKGLAGLRSVSGGTAQASKAGREDKVPSPGAAAKSSRSAPEPVAKPAAEPAGKPAGIEDVPRVSYSPEDVTKARQELSERADLLRRDLATSVLKLEEFSPSTEELSKAFWDAVAKTSDQKLERFVRRSLDMSEEILAAWRDSDDRRHRSWRQDMESGTLVLCAVNPLQAAKTDLLSLVTLVRLRSNPDAAESRINRALDKVRRELSTRLGKELMAKAAFQPLPDFVAGLMKEGRPRDLAVQEWIRSKVAEVLGAALVALRESEGISVPGLVEHLLGAYASLSEELGRHLNDSAGE